VLRELLRNTPASFHPGPRWTRITLLVMLKTGRFPSG
jgi:hypothetical protein